MEKINIKLTLNELKLIDYCILQCIINSKKDTKILKEAKNLIAKLRKINIKN